MGMGDRIHIVARYLVCMKYGLQYSSKLDRVLEVLGDSDHLAGQN